MPLTRFQSPNYRYPWLLISWLIAISHLILSNGTIKSMLYTLIFGKYFAFAVWAHSVPIKKLSSMGSGDPSLSRIAGYLGGDDCIKRLHSLFILFIDDLPCVPKYHRSLSLVGDIKTFKVILCIQSCLEVQLDLWNEITNVTTLFDYGLDGIPLSLMWFKWPFHVSVRLRASFSIHRKRVTQDARFYQTMCRGIWQRPLVKPL